MKMDPPESKLQVSVSTLARKERQMLIIKMLITDNQNKGLSNFN